MLIHVASASQSYISYSAGYRRLGWTSCWWLICRRRWASCTFAIHHSHLSCSSSVAISIGCNNNRGRLSAPKLVLEVYPIYRKDYSPHIFYWIFWIERLTQWQHHPLLTFAGRDIPDERCYDLGTGWLLNIQQALRRIDDEAELEPGASANFWVRSRITNALQMACKQKLDEKTLCFSKNFYLEEFSI